MIVVLDLAQVFRCPRVVPPERTFDAPMGRPVDFESEHVEGPPIAGRREGLVEVGQVLIGEEVEG